MKKLLICILLSLASINLYSQNCLKLDIMIIADLSGCMLHKHNYVQEALRMFVNRFELAENGVKISTIVFGHETIILSPLTSNKKLLNQSIDSMLIHNIGDFTFLNDALTIAMGSFTKKCRADTDKIVIIISDGGVNYPIAVFKTSQIIKYSYNYTIYSIYTDGDINSDKELMKSIASENRYVETNYELLIKILESLDMCI